MKPIIATVPVLAMALALAACGKEPTGQVAAVVNGEEITLQEINAELGDAQIPEGADGQAIRSAVLQRIIDRRILAQQAREDGLDETPEFLVRQRQLEDALLVQLLQQRAQRSAAVPSAQAIDQFIRENPSSFGDRRIYTLDRIQFPMPPDPSQLRALEPAKTMDQVAAALDGLGIRYNRAPAQMDSARVGEQRLRAILAVPNNEPFVTPEAGMVTVAVITGSQPANIGPDGARAAATEALRMRSIQTTLENRLKAAKTSAEITYQPGFAPKTAPTGGGRAAPAGTATAAPAAGTTAS